MSFLFEPRISSSLYRFLSRSPNIVCLYQQRLIFVFFLLFEFLLTALIYSTLLPFSGHELYFVLLVVQSCSFQFHLDHWMKPVTVAVSGTLPHFSQQEVLQKYHDVIIWPFPFHRSPTTWYFFILIFFFPSYNYFLICHISLHFWESEKENLFQVSCHQAIIYVFGLL